MLERIRGELRGVGEQSAAVVVGPIDYEVLVPAGDAARLRLAVGEQVEFLLLHYLESQANGAVFRPRLVGFSSEADRAFFELLTSVKGIGYRKALRALAMPIATVARAVAEKDVDTLRALPEIGKRTAETIVLDLAEKVEQLMPGVLVEDAGGTDGTEAEGGGGTTAAAREAVLVLVQLGESRLAAVELVDRACRADPELAESDALVAAALRLKELTV
ncbi:MAG: Holliday junction branch migration protein RuvA [Planctomycetota bacterium]|nr:Holliday junction branch migration protein RuvA [Planctomycetota bacterium]MEE2894870.1 Holliday junction branch migration protein RuvA [Planctomycetota bacterium]